MKTGRGSITNNHGMLGGKKTSNWGQERCSYLMKPEGRFERKDLLMSFDGISRCYRVV